MMRCRIAANRIVPFVDNMHAEVVGDSPVRLWGLTPAERIERQLRAEGVALRRDGSGTIPANDTLLVLRGDCLYDGRVLRGLAKARQVLLEGDVDGRRMPLAAHVAAAQASAAADCCAASVPPGSLADSAVVSIEQVAKGYEMGLKKLDRPFVLPVTDERRAMLEQLTFSGAYKGVTDLVTKWLWPVPAQWVTRGACACASRRTR